MRDRLRAARPGFVCLSTQPHRALWRGALLAYLAVAASLWPGAAPRLHAQSSGDPLVLAFYYPWYDDSTWSTDRLSDLPAQPYVSSDRGVMGRQIDQAKAAGIDALIVAWYGPGGNNPTESNLAAMLEEAAARNFRIGILFETDSPFLGGPGDVTAALQHIQSVHAASPAFLRADGRPVIFFWRPTIYGSSTWQDIRSQADPGYAQFWIAEGIDTSLLSVFDGHHLYSNTWNPAADLTALNQKFAGQVRAAGKLWVATVMPGYNDVRIRGGGGFARDREQGAYYASSWQAAIASAPNWIVVNSFNEWPEGSYIEPSAAFGDAYLGLTATWSQQFKAGGVHAAAVAPAPLIAQAAAAPPGETLEGASAAVPEPDRPTARVNTALVNLRSGPGVDFAVVGQAANGDLLPITGQQPDQPEWWQVDYAGSPAWVFRELVVAAGPLETTPVIAAPVAAGAPVAVDTPVAPPLYDPARSTLQPYLSR